MQNSTVVLTISVVAEVEIPSGAIYADLPDGGAHSIGVTNGNLNYAISLIAID